MSKLKVKVILLPQNKKINEHGDIVINCKVSPYASPFIGIRKALNSAPQDYLQAQHLYLVSDREITAGDWCLCNDALRITDNPKYFIGKCKSITNGWIDVIEGQSENPDWTSKIEATTDENIGNLVNSFDNSIPRIPQSFIEKYVEKQGDIKEVMIEMEGRCINGHSSVAQAVGSVCTYPHCGELVTLQSATRFKDNTVIISRVKDSWNRDELKQAVWQAWTKDIPNASPHYISNVVIPEFEEWFEQNIK